MQPLQERQTSPVSKKSDFIDLGGGMTPRPKENPDILLRSSGTTLPNINVSKFKTLLRKYTETGKVDKEDFNSGPELGAFIDFINNTKTAAKQKEFNETITEINKYYWKLWIKAMESR